MSKLQSPPLEERVGERRPLRREAAPGLAPKMPTEPSFTIAFVPLSPALSPALSPRSAGGERENPLVGMLGYARSAPRVFCLEGSGDSRDESRHARQ